MVVVAISETVLSQKEILFQQTLIEQLHVQEPVLFAMKIEK